MLNLIHVEKKYTYAEIVSGVRLCTRPGFLKRNAQKTACEIAPAVRTYFRVRIWSFLKIHKRESF
jgi:hypothetical protein